MDAGKRAFRNHVAHDVDGIVHYCVANMPGAVARTSTFALNNATIGHAVALANDPEVGTRVLAAWQERDARPPEPQLGPKRRSDLLALIAG